MNKKHGRALIYLIIALVSLILFEIVSNHALEVRELQSCGGEYFILLIPFLVYTIEIGIKER